MDRPKDRLAVHLIIKGSVQGVGYRWWAQGEARRFGLDGWVRNRHDGTVELVAVGPEAAVEEMIEACWLGPPAAAVHVVIRSAAEDEVPGGFAELPTV
jgi:acylphosphatase